MGGLKKDLPITYWTFLIGAIAIAGVPGLAGFFSKDEILAQTFFSGHTILWVIGVLTALLTATYMFRLVFLAFHGTPRYALPPVHEHAHARALMVMDRARATSTRSAVTCTTPRRRWLLALIVLAIGSVVGRLRRRASGARRQQSDRALPRTKLRAATCARWPSRPREPHPNPPQNQVRLRLPGRVAPRPPEPSTARPRSTP